MTIILPGIPSASNMAKTPKNRIYEYAFLLGRKPLLSLTELCAVFPEAEPVIVQPEFAIFKFPPDQDKMAGMLQYLGGTIKIMAVTDWNPAQCLLSLHDPERGKCTFAVNVYGKSENILRTILKNTKKKLKEAKISSRFLNKNFHNASHVAVFENKLWKRHSDFNILATRKMTGAAGSCDKDFTGVTIAIQNFKHYSKRDYEKPFRDARAGMLPPKLAQIMVNLARSGDSTHHYIVDPFCGTGTILMEALLMGYNATGSDIEEKMVEGSKKNLRWMSWKFQPHQKYDVNLMDATTLGRENLPSEKFAIVTETYLGPPLSKFPPADRLKQIEDKLLDLYLRFFDNLASVAPSGTPIVIAIPCFRQTRGSSKSSRSQKNATESFHFLPRFIDKIESLGYSMSTLIPKKLRQRIPSDLLQLDEVKKRGLVYDRPDQTIGREIIKFIRN